MKYPSNIHLMSKLSIEGYDIHIGKINPAYDNDLSIVVLRKKDKKVLLHLQEPTPRGMDRPSLPEDIKTECRKFLTSRYDEGVPLISDQLYDELFQYSVRDNNDLVSNEHYVPMLGIHSSTKESNVYGWVDKMSNEFQMPEESLKFSVSTKYDGVALSLEGNLYENGLILYDKVLTRGRGRGIGQQVPLANKFFKIWDGENSRVAAKLVVRGELVISYADFKELNNKMEEIGNKPYKEPRSVAAAAVSQKTYDPEIGALIQWCTFMVYDQMSFGSKKEIVDYNLEYATQIPWQTGNCTIKGVIKELDLDTYPSDGVVIRLDDPKKFRNGMHIGKVNNPYIFALKPKERMKLAIVTDVVWEKGRLGDLVPVAYIEPITFGGKEVRKLGVYNYATVKGDKIVKGSRIMVVLSGEVTPTYMKGSGKPPKREPNPKIPYPRCNECGIPGTQVGDSKHITCTSLVCNSELKRAINYYRILGLKGITIKGVSQFLLDSSAHWSDLGELKWGCYIDNKLFSDSLSEITNGDLPAHTAIQSLGFKSVGDSTSKKLARLCKGDLLSLVDKVDTGIPEDIGWADENRWEHLADEIADMCDVFEYLDDTFHITYETEESSALQGKKVVITGAFAGTNRKEVTAYVERQGGTVMNSTSSNTDLVVYGKRAGSKKERAERLGIELLTLEELVDRVGISGDWE